MKVPRPGPVVILASALTLACACSGSTSTERQASTLANSSGPAATAGDDYRVAFKWPVPGSVQVEEDMMENGKRVRLRYRLTIERQPSSDKLIIRHRDIQVAEARAGDPPVDPEFARQHSQPIAPILVSAEGQFLEVTDLPWFIQELQRAGLVPDEHVPLVQLQLQTEESQQALAERVSTQWGVWLQVWMREDMPRPGAPIELDDENAGKVVIENLGPPDDAPGHLRLQYTATQDDYADKFKAQLDAEGIAAGAGPSPYTVEKAHSRLEMSVEIERATGKPRWARSRIQDYKKVSGFDEDKLDSVREFRFTW